MKKSGSVVAMLICAVASVWRAEAVQYWAISTHPCTVTDCDGGELSFARHSRADGGCYYIFNTDWGATDLIINESGSQSTITANEPSGYRFKGWYTKTSDWTGDEASVSLVDKCIETSQTISGDKIKSAGSWNARPTIVAKYVPLYLIGTAVDPVGAGNVEGAGTYEEGSSASLKAIAKAGWAFEKWSDGNASNPRTLSNISAAATYTAVFKPLFKNVTLEKTGGTAGTDSIVVTNGFPLPKIAVPTRTGYDFKGYYTSESGDDAIQYYTLSGTSAKNWSADEKATALFARWQAKQFTVRFFNDGATSGPEPITVTYGKDPGQLNVVPGKEDYKFDGYYLGAACYWDGSGKWVGGSSWTYIPEDGDVVTLTARYIADQYAVKFDANGGTGTYEDLSVAVNAEFTLPDGEELSKVRHKFSGWALSSEGKKAYEGGVATTVAANKRAASQNPNQLTFYAVWTDLSCTVRFNAGSAEATVNPETKQVEAGAAFGELATATWLGERCTLAGWWNAEGKQIDEDSIVPEAVNVVDLYARWTTNDYSIAFHENGGSGTMNAQTLPFYASVALSPNQFVRDGYQFAGWATNATEAVVFEDGDPVRDLATTKGAVIDLYAKWSANDYTVAFYGNGGTNAMAAQSFTYDVEQGLSSNQFVREDFTFVGWATDPTNGVAYADGAVVTNLTPAAGGVFRLYAKWTANGGDVVSDFSRALDCGEVNFLPDDENFVSIIDESTAENGTCVRISIADKAENAKHIHSVTGCVHGAGRLSFSYKGYAAVVTVEGKTSFAQVSGSDEKLVLETEEKQLAEMEWKTQAIEFSQSIESLDIGWSLQRNNFNGTSAILAKKSDNDFLLIDNVRWEPAETNATMVGVTFRDAEGGVFDNVTRAVGEAYGELPVPTDPLGRDFYGWECNGEEIDEMWSVPNYAQGVEVLSRWGAIPVVTNAVPTAVAGLVYDGTAKTGVAEGANYAVAGNVATNAGDYVAVATVTNGVWEGGATGATNIAWTIAKAAAPDVGGVSFTDATYEFDGTERTIAVSGTVPAGVAVVYSGDPTNRTEVGTNTVTASFKVLDTNNYEAITTTLTAKLIITAKEEPPEPPEPVVTNAVPTAVAGLVYDGTAKTGVAEGANYAVAGNVATNAGDYVAVATVTNGVWEGGATGATNITWTIAKAAAPGVSGVTFTDATYEFDGTERTIAVSGTVPAGVAVVYSGDPTNRTEVGTNTVTASFRVLDETNYEAITTTLTAKLIITAKEEPPTPPEPTVAYENIYFKATLAELGADAVPTNRKVTVKAEGLPKGLKLVTTALKDAKGKATGFYAYMVEGVPTETMDGLNRIAYVRVTDNKVQTLYVLDLEVRPAEEYEQRSFPDGTNKVAYTNFSVADLWPDVAVNPKNWTFSGWPAGIKYASKDTKGAKAYEVYGTPTKAGRFTVKAVEKIAGTSYKSTHVATFTVWPQGEVGNEWTDQAYVGVYRKTDESVKSASGLPTGVKFTAKNIVSKNVVTTEAHHFYGTPTKAGTYAVTLTHEDGPKTQFLWTITPAAAPTFGVELAEAEVDSGAAKATVRAGVSYDWTIDCASNATVTASGLPTGLKLVKTPVKSGTKTVGYTYSVAGVPTKAGEFFVTFTTKLNGISTVTTAAFTVLDLPDWAQGTFDGGVGASEISPGGQVTLTVSKAGKLNGKWMSIGTNWTLTATSYARYDRENDRYYAEVVRKTGSGKNAVSVTEALWVSSTTVGGLAECGLFPAYQNNWKTKTWKTAGSAFSKAKELVFVPDGYETNDTISLKFAASGKVTVKGKFVKSVSDKGTITWYSVSGSAVLCPQTELGEANAFGGYVFVYLPPKVKTPLSEGGYTVCVPVIWDGTKFDIWKQDDE